MKTRNDHRLMSLSLVIAFLVISTTFIFAENPLLDRNRDSDSIALELTRVAHSGAVEICISGTDCKTIWNGQTDLMVYDHQTNVVDWKTEDVFASWNVHNSTGDIYLYGKKLEDIELKHQVGTLIEDLWSIRMYHASVADDLKKPNVLVTYQGTEIVDGNTHCEKVTMNVLSDDGLIQEIYHVWIASDDMAIVKVEHNNSWRGGTIGQNETLVSEWNILQQLQEVIPISPLNTGI